MGNAGGHPNLCYLPRRIGIHAIHWRSTSSNIWGDVSATEQAPWPLSYSPPLYYRHEPETRWFSLTTNGGKDPALPFPFAIVLCSDGVWDNWKFTEVSSFVLHPLRLEGVRKEQSSASDAVDVEKGAAQDLSKELMVANKKRAFMNFGNSADNMTAVVAAFIPVTEGGSSK